VRIAGRPGRALVGQRGQGGPQLPISKDLADQLNAWSDDCDATLVLDDPASSGFPDEEIGLLGMHTWVGPTERMTKTQDQ
jgi:hypothetical protein